MRDGATYRLCRPLEIHCYTFCKTSGARERSKHCGIWSGVVRRTYIIEDGQDIVSLFLLLLLWSGCVQSFAVARRSACWSQDGRHDWYDDVHWGVWDICDVL